MKQKAKKSVTEWAFGELYGTSFIKSSLKLTMDTSKFNVGQAHFTNLEWIGLGHKNTYMNMTMKDQMCKKHKQASNYTPEDDGEVSVIINIKTQTSRNQVLSAQKMSTKVWQQQSPITTCTVKCKMFYPVNISYNTHFGTIDFIWTIELNENSGLQSILNINSPFILC